MISLAVHLDDSLVQALLQTGWSGLRDGWRMFCQARSLEGLYGPQGLLAEAAEITEEGTRRIKDCSTQLLARIDESLERIKLVRPPVAEDVRFAFTAIFLPFGKGSFGPKEGLQIFSLYPEAVFSETFLFLVHVYYHEVSALNYTERCRACSRRTDSADDFKYWVKLLIRNEGIANQAVLADLLAFRDQHPKYQYRYFTYARQILDKESLNASISVLYRVLSAADDSNAAVLRG